MRPRLSLRKKWVLAGGVVIVSAAAMAIGAFAAADPMQLFVNGKAVKTEVPPKQENNHILVPIEAVAEALGAKVEWDKDNNAVVITQPAKEDVNNDEESLDDYLRYYPKAPAKMTTPQMALDAYFAALFYATNLNRDQMMAISGSVGDQEPYPTAYGYWTPTWREAHSYEDYLASWEGTLNVQLLKLLPAGEINGKPRFYVETRHIEASGSDTPRLGIFYYYGFFTLEDTDDGWRIADGALRPEELDWQLGGHQPWRGEPTEVAMDAVYRLGEVKSGFKHDAPEEQPDGTTRVRFHDDGGQEITVTLVQRQDGIWQVLAIKQ